MLKKLISPLYDSEIKNYNKSLLALAETIKCDYELYIQSNLRKDCRDSKLVCKYRSLRNTLVLQYEM